MNEYYQMLIKFSHAVGLTNLSDSQVKLFAELQHLENYLRDGKPIYVDAAIAGDNNLSHFSYSTIYHYSPSDSILQNRPPEYDLSGTWHLEEEYDGGTTQGSAQLTQQGSYIVGSIKTLDANEFSGLDTIKQELSGFVLGTVVVLRSTSYTNESGELYNLDTWSGEAKSQFEVQGSSIDTGGITGNFLMKKTSEEAL